MLTGSQTLATMKHGAMVIGRVLTKPETCIWQFANLLSTVNPLLIDPWEVSAWEPPIPFNTSYILSVISTDRAFLQRCEASVPPFHPNSKRVLPLDGQTPWNLKQTRNIPSLLNAWVWTSLRSEHHYGAGHSENLEYKGPLGVLEELQIIYMFQKTLAEYKPSDIKIMLYHISSLN